MIEPIKNFSGQEFQRHWNLEQQLEILALCGNNHLISCVAITTRLDPEPMAARFGGRTLE